MLPSYVELSERFFREVTTRPVPLSLDALKALRGARMRLDIYAWLAHRMSLCVQADDSVLDSLMLQFGSNAKTVQARHKFRKDSSATWLQS